MNGYRWNDRCTDVIDVRMDRWIDRWMDRWIGEWINMHVMIVAGEEQFEERVDR